jgi:hypothetical protein
MLSVILMVLCQPGANEVNYSLIQLGMTRQQVAAIDRQPPVAQVTDADRFSISSSLSSPLIRQEGELWRTGKRKLWVVFDEDQRATGKMIERDEVDLTSLPEQMSPLIWNVLRGEDHLWKYWCIVRLVSVMPVGVAEQFRSELRRIAEQPTAAERTEELDEAAQDALLSLWPSGLG